MSAALRTQEGLVSAMHKVARTLQATCAGRSRRGSPEFVEDVCLRSKLLKRPRLPPKDANWQNLHIGHKEPRQGYIHLDRLAWSAR